MEKCICCICHEDVSQLNDVVLQCNHVYHSYCIMKWKDINPVCPLCRHNLEPIRMFSCEFIHLFRVFITMCYVINLTNISVDKVEFID